MHSQSSHLQSQRGLARVQYFRNVEAPIEGTVPSVIKEDIDLHSIHSVASSEDDPGFLPSERTFLNVLNKHLAQGEGSQAPSVPPHPWRERERIKKRQSISF